jgi:diguanylate cyclase (GGDEF)-like protein
MPLALLTRARAATRSLRGDARLGGSWGATQPDGRAVSRLLGAQYLAGSVVIIIGLLLPTQDPSDRPYLLGIAAFSVVMGLCLRVTPRASSRAANLSITLLVFVVTAVVLVARPMGLSPLYYFWPLMASAYYASPRRLLVNTALTIGAFGVALATGAETNDPTLAFVCFTGVAVAVVITVRRLRAQLAGLFSELEVLASRDSLTGILNRRAFDGALAGASSDHRSSGTDAALLIFDIDHFKAVNDTHGHPAGDAALRRLTDIVSQEIRASDVFGRVGGEEFGVLMPGITAPDAERAAERIRLAVAARTAGTGVPFTISGGLALSLDAGDPWAAADRALYAAKDAGRNRVVVAGAHAVRGETTGQFTALAAPARDHAGQAV